MLLHPRGEIIFINCSDGLSRSIDAGSGVILQSFGNSTFRTNNRRFSITPCGTMLLTTDDDEIIGWNLLNGNKVTKIKLPIIQHHKICYISSMDYHQHNNFLIASVYGSGNDGSIFLLAYSTDTNKETSTNVEKLNLDRVPTLSTGHFAENQDLSKIIQRIDDIFLLPQNKTDDVKAGSVSVISPVGSVEADSSDESSENNTFVVMAEDDDAGTFNLQSQLSSSGCGTFTVHNNNSKSHDNETFSISNTKSGRKNIDGTFSINGGDQSDDTTISESL